MGRIIKGVRWRTIKKSQLPPIPDKGSHDLYGEWVAMARTMRLLAPDEALEVELGEIQRTCAVSSLHAAARKHGIRISTMSADGKLYVLRTSMGALPRRAGMEFTCSACGERQATIRPRQKYCRRRACQLQRTRRNRAASEQRNSERLVAAKGEA